MRTRTAHHVRFRRRLTVRLTSGVVLSLLVVGVPFALAFHRLLRAQQIEALQDATMGLSRVIVDGLRSAMVGGQPHLLDRALANLASEPEVVRVILIDHNGAVRVTSDPAFDGRVLEREKEETCRVCHRTGGVLPTTRSTIVSVGGQRVFRTMNVIRNSPECHGCHDPAHRTNGILLMDLGLEAPDRRFLANIQGTVALGSVMAALTFLVLVWMLQRMVHRPLQSIVAASERVAGGDLEARAPVEGPGEFAVLASRVNRMTDHLARTLRTVDRQRGELQSILDSVDDEIVVLDRKMRIVAANRSFRSECDPDPEVIGRPCQDASAWRGPCDSEGCPVQRVFETGRLQKAIFSRAGPHGEEQTIEIHASPLLDTDGIVANAVEVRRDISERRQMEASLSHSEHLASLGLLASGVSHEINNPLAAIATSVEGLRRRLPDIAATERTAELEAVLIRIEREVRRGRSITHSLLKVARRPGGSRSLIDINQLVREIVGILSHEIRTQKISTHLALAEGMPPYPGDESQLGQVIMNLTLNAVQALAGNGGGTLRIETSATPEEIRVAVADNGPGIPPELHKRIFEPFFTTKPVGRGTGLGLFITHRAITALGGSVQVRSEPGKGTEFRVHVPRSGPGGTR